ncbi:MAG TPA: HD domain-containing protein [Caulobacterales bacterium]|nr:HD domain-containing protein [Caulobacterales bacterium]
MTDMRTQSIAGVSTPDTPLIADAIAYARQLSEPWLFNHAMRSWLFAARLGRARALQVDEEAMAIGAVLHDIGLTAGIGGGNRFEVNGANAARAFLAERGLEGRRAQVIWDLVALNSTPSIALHKEPEIALGTMGIALDFGGFGFEAEIPAAEMAEILRAFPRLEMKRNFAATCRHLVETRPETSSDNFLRDFGERFVPGYKPVSTVDLLMRAPFAE